MWADVRKTVKAVVYPTVISLGVHVCYADTPMARVETPPPTDAKEVSEGIRTLISSIGAANTHFDSGMTALIEMRRPSMTGQFIRVVEQP